MSMVNDIFGIGRTAYTESTDTIEPEIADMKLEDAEDLDEGTDLMEFMTGVAYECDMNMRNLEMAIVADEFNYLRENGQEMVYEEGRIQGIIDKFKANCKWLWEQIQKYYKAALKKIEEVTKFDTRFLNKYKSKASGNTGIYNGPTIEGMKTNLESINTHLKNMETASTNVANKYLKDANCTDINTDKNTNDNGGSNFVKDNMNIIFKQVFNTDADSDASNAKDVYSTIMKKMKEKKGVNKLSGAEACTGFEKVKELKSQLKDAYNKSKKVINSHLKAAKKAESVTKKLKVVPTKLSGAVHKVVKILSTIGKWCSQANKFGVKLYNMIRNAYKSVIVSAAAASGKGGADDSKKDTATESALDTYVPGMGII